MKIRIEAELSVPDSLIKDSQEPDDAIDGVRNFIADYITIFTIDEWRINRSDIKKMADMYVASHDVIE